MDYPGIPDAFANDCRLMLCETAIFDFHATCVQADQEDAIRAMVASLSDVTAVGLINFSRHAACCGHLQVHYEDDGGMVVRTEKAKHLWGNYLVLGRGATGFDDSSARAELEWIAESLGLAFGEAVTAELHFRGLYRRGDQDPRRFGSPGTEGNRRKVWGEWDDFDEIQDLTGSWPGRFTLNRQASTFLQAARAANDSVTEFILVWTAFEYQLRQLPGKSSGERRKAFMSELHSEPLDRRLYDIFEKRSAILKGSSLQIENGDIRFIKLLIRVLATRGSSVYRRLADGVLIANDKSSWIKLVS